MNPATLISVNDEWLTVRDVAQKLGRSEPTVRRAIGRGDLAAYQFGERGYSVAPSDLQAFISKRRKCGDVAGVAAGTEDLAKTG
jgi:excisionase family DNA binding protein